MADYSHETIAARFTRLNQLIVGKSNYNLPKKHLVHRDGLLDVLFALYEECNVDYLRKDKHIAAFVDKFKGVMVQLKSMRVNLKDFEVKKIIGRGHFGEVQVVREKATGDVYAMKVLRKQETLSQKNMAFFEEERDIMAKSTSPWLTKLQYAFQDNQNLYLMMEFHPGGDLLSLLEKYDNVLPEEMVQFYLAELVLAIQSLHSMGYVHRDIKPDNILIDRTGHIKLADFGSSSKLNNNKQVTSSMPVGTPDYVAPEVLTAMNAGPASSKSYGVECDWWSLGIVTYEMVFGSTPFTNEKLLLTYSNIMNFKNSLKFPPEASQVSETLIDLIKNLLQEPTLRYGYNQLIMHSLFTDVDWNNIRHIAPPFVPTVMGVDDTSNFDDFETENRHFSSDLSAKREFSGKNLPFVGFTYTSPFETLVEKSSSDESRTFPPNTSLTEVDAGSRRKEISLLQHKISQLCIMEETLKNEIQKLKSNVQTKDRDVESTKAEKVFLEQMVVELQNEVRQVKQLLYFEKEHRSITEKKAAHLVRCMKTRQKQDAIRLRAKSQEYGQGESGQASMKQQLDDALQRVDECIREKADLLEELHDTKHVLLECQQKLYEKEQELLLTSSGSVSNDSSTVTCSCNNTSNNVNQDITKRLVSKLEKKNISLESELEAALKAKKKAQQQADALKDVVEQLESKIEESALETTESPLPNKEEKIRNSIKKYQKELASKQTTIAEIQKKLLNEEEVNAQLKQKLEAAEADILIYKDIKKLGDEKIQSLQEKILALEKESVGNTNFNCNLSPRKSSQFNPSPVKSTCRNSSPDKAVFFERKSRNEKQERLLLESDLKHENESLKARIEVLLQEVNKLKDASKSTKELTTKIKELEDALSDAKLDVKVSTRKVEEIETVSSSLRERNKDLREKLKAAEEMTLAKTKAEDDFKDKLKALESELARMKTQADRSEKSHQIEIAKLEERIKTMKDTWESSKDLNQKFAKSQGQYEEISRQNMDLTKECAERDKKISDLLHENKNLKSDLSTRLMECNKYKQVNGVLKSSCIELEEDFKDFEILVESRDKAIAELTEDNEKLLKEIKKLKDALKNTDSGIRKEEKEKEDLLKHINELTQEIENQNYLHETEMQNLQSDLSHYKNVIVELDDQAAHYQRELSLLDNSSKGSSEHIMTLESQLCEIKEEAARHITQILSLKGSNLKLTQALDDALANQQEAQKNIEDLFNELESEKAKHNHEKVKLQQTVSQQTKLIDFLQSKTENMEKKKRPNISRLFGKKENIPLVPPPRDFEKLLETERSRCRRLQDQLSQTRAEKMALQGEINALSKSSSTNTEVPVSPMSRAMHNAITFSPTTHSEMDSPVLTSKELLSRIVKPAGMKHKIPHRFAEIMCMRSTKCCACLDSIHFGRPIVKCQECSVICHPKCSTSLPNTCGLPSGFMQHFRSAIQDSSSEDSSQVHNGRSEGWIKIPKSNKQGWDRRYLRLVDDILYLFENAEETDQEEALIEFDFGSGDAKIAVTSAVPATELPYAATSDLPYVFKLESFPKTTCWPQRCLYIMTSSFNDKQMWVSALENLSEKYATDQVDELNKNKLSGKSIWTLKSDKLIDPLCSTILDENVILLGAMEGLYVLKIVNKYTCSLQEKLEGFSSVYQIACMKKIGILILIHGEDRKLSVTNLGKFESKLYGSSKYSTILNSVADIKGCHLFAVEEISNTDAPYICVATSDSVMLCQWDSASKTFYSKKVIEASEPCSCIHFTPKSVIFGTDVFYELSLGSYSAKKFLDGTDSTLAGLVYGASQFRSYPVAIFQISMDRQNKEYLLCFHEMGVFVDCHGKRTRSEDMKWSRLPLSFAYQSPYLFITHFTSLKVIEISPHNASEFGIRACMSVRNPHYMGLAHIPHSILIASTHNGTMELMLVDGSSAGSSGFQMQDTSDDASSAVYTGSISSAKGSIGESDAVDLDFSFATSVEQSSDHSLDRSSLSSKGSTDSVS